MTHRPTVRIGGVRSWWLTGPTRRWLLTGATTRVGVSGGVPTGMPSLLLVLVRLPARGLFRGQAGLGRAQPRQPAFAGAQRRRQLVSARVTEQRVFGRVHRRGLSQNLLGQLAELLFGLSH